MDSTADFPPAPADVCIRKILGLPHRSPPKPLLPPPPHSLCTNAFQETFSSTAPSRLLVALWQLCPLPQLFWTWPRRFPQGLAFCSFLLHKSTQTKPAQLLVRRRRHNRQARLFGSTSSAPRKSRSRRRLQADRSSNSSRFIAFRSSSLVFGTI